MKINDLETLKAYVKNYGVANTLKYLISVPLDERNNISFAYNSSGYVYLSLLVHLHNN